MIFHSAFLSIYSSSSSSSSTVDRFVSVHNSCSHKGNHDPRYARNHIAIFARQGFFFSLDRLINKAKQ